MTYKTRHIENGLLVISGPNDEKEIPTDELDAIEVSRLETTDDENNETTGRNVEENSYSINKNVSAGDNEGNPTENIPSILTKEKPNSCAWFVPIKSKIAIKTALNRQCRR